MPFTAHTQIVSCVSSAGFTCVMALGQTSYWAPIEAGKGSASGPQKLTIFRLFEINMINSEQLGGSICILLKIVLFVKKQQAPI